jgi:ubiquitin-like domain-containing CTD phosphatase 1
MKCVRKPNLPGKVCVFAAATSMKWIDAKMEELGMLSNPNFKISMVMDDLAMITVDTPTYGVIEACFCF